MQAKPTELTVTIPTKPALSYPIFIGENILEQANTLIKKHTKAKKLLVVTNETIINLYPTALKLDNAEFLILKDGEQYKNLESYQQILTKALELKLERTDAFVAFGGGVIGDMTGFCAATYLRGIDFIQIPTTLLAQVDSSVGGKVAVNTPFGKNLVGAFYQPKLVIADTSVLKTLDNRQFKTGLAEVVKYAFIEKTAQCNYKFFDFLSENATAINQRSHKELAEMIKICCEIKANVVNQDEQEKGLRAILNFGHTFAHAIEKITNFTHFTHGEAVAIGMKLVFNLAQKQNFITKEYAQEAIELLNAYNLNYSLPTDISPKALIDAMAYDKKVQNNKVRFVIPIASAEVEIQSDIDPLSAFD